MHSYFFVVDLGDADVDTVVVRECWGCIAAVQGRRLVEGVGKADDLLEGESLAGIDDGTEKGVVARIQSVVVGFDAVGESLAGVVDGAGDWEQHSARAAKGSVRGAGVDHCMSDEDPVASIGAGIQLGEGSLV